MHSYLLCDQSESEETQSTTESWEGGGFKNSKHKVGREEVAGTAGQPCDMVVHPPCPALRKCAAGGKGGAGAGCLGAAAVSLGAIGCRAGLPGSLSCYTWSAPTPGGAAMSLAAAGSTAVAVLAVHSCSVLRILRRFQGDQRVSLHSGAAHWGFRPEHTEKRRACRDTGVEGGDTFWDRRRAVAPAQSTGKIQSKTGLPPSSAWGSMGCEHECTGAAVIGCKYASQQA